jgi:3-deoxy-D-manno-octulosonic-acid transferase
MIHLYRILFPFLSLLFLPVYLIRMYRRGGYGAMMAGRVGACVRVPRTAGCRRLWIHAVSVGELLAIEPLLDGLKAEGGIEVYLTTTTSTGFALACQKYRDRVVAVDSFPLDFFPFVERAWRRIQPDLAVMTEGELWPEHLHAARRHRVPVVLMNARLSDRSFQRMRRFRFFRMLSYDLLQGVAAASEVDASRICSLGYPASRMEVVGNLKMDFPIPELDQREALRLRLLEHSGLGAGLPEGGLTPVLLGASTWPGEEELLIDCLLYLREKGLPVELILVPRHAERRESIRDMLRRRGDVGYAFRSRPDWRELPSGKEAGGVQVYVADTTGELRQFLQLATVAVVGKSFFPHREGQTPVEAAALGVPVVYGRGMSNFRAITSALEQSGGSACVDAGDLPELLEQLLRSPERREQMALAARAVVQSGQGSTRRLMAFLKRHWQGNTPVGA